MSRHAVSVLHFQKAAKLVESKSEHSTQVSLQLSKISGKERTAPKSKVDVEEETDKETAMLLQSMIVFFLIIFYNFNRTWWS